MLTYDEISIIRMSFKYNSYNTLPDIRFLPIYMDKCNDKTPLKSTNICIHLIDEDMCKLDGYFRCVEKVPVLSYSGMNNFMTCRRLYKLSNRDGWQLKWKGLSGALKIGSWVDSKLTGSKCRSHENDKNSLWLMKAQAILKGIRNLTGLNVDNFDTQVKIVVNLGEFKLQGYIDFVNKNLPFFMDLKCSTRVQYYSNRYWVEDQMGTYFMSDSKLEYMYMFIAKTPELRKGAVESLEDYRQRCYDDMENRTDFYFHRIKFYRKEFNIDELKKRYEWLAGEIKRCVETDYWYKDKTQCLNKFGKCDMIGICDSGGVSNRLYEKREKKR